ncbi:MAG: hypothetical protein H6712_30470 [Myxococcales bacterium]|nr:hypothetical protein [Myxococcales bacterium]MCB9718214.1 hypothetical protein [Myxococcales bacterium]
MSPCDEDRPCEGRAQVCDLETLECVAAEVDTSSTLDPAPASFADQVIPFFRGEVCLPHEAQSGAPLPILMRPCLHPCIAASSYEFRHTFSCVGSRCDALALMWVSGSGSACPPDAFGQFDATQCQYATEVEFTIDTNTSNGPISGTMEVEVPFLSNADMATIAANADDATIRQLVDQYPEDAGRIPDGRPVSLLASNPAPPASCRDGACPCYPIGL